MRTTVPPPTWGRLGGGGLVVTEFYQCLTSAAHLWLGCYKDTKIFSSLMVTG